MTKAQVSGLRLLLFGCVLFVVIGVMFERISVVSMADFKAVYCGARVLLEHGDPYNPATMDRVYQTEAGGRATDPALLRTIVTGYIYPPTTFLLTVPFALLPWGVAHVAWMIATGSLFIYASWLMWSVAAERAPVTAGALFCIFIATSELLIEVGNSAGIAVSLCAIAVWCFLRNRRVRVGVVCLAVSLLVKPHDAGMVWLFFLLVGGTMRRRALETLALTIVLSLPAVAWVSVAAPRWMPEMNANLAAHGAHGADSDPGPDGLNPTGHGAQLISLQTAISVFKDDAGFYNPASYLVGGALLLAWCVVVVRSRFSASNAWLALASVSALSMLATYHRQQDTRMLLLMFPALALLITAGGWVRRFALAVTGVAVVLTGDLPLQILAIVGEHIGASTSGFRGQMLTLLLARPAPIALLAVGVFYLWAFARSVRSREQELERADPNQAPSLSAPA